ncbi:valine--tRNA ligase, chloroplastic/mitochondrial 2 isoform X2 [Senna tora]|uniref:Valine--tRNA ligase, chloroplastic/mitochondrial 2 isoform X2 n=1 Tax=Senna tora TaxID=362788 RepID=A0A834XAJ1_9FABA|nr:valine--tRNA ligase, chloroplastic/mitochondrial 2 isoform X2 [Senna tora]
MFLNSTVGASLLLPLCISPQFRTKRILKSSIVLLSKKTLSQSDIEDSPNLIATQKRRREAESHSAALRKEGNGAKNKRSLFTLRYGAQKTNEAMEVGIARYVTLEEEHHMKGRPTPWLPGTDHAGIATQLLAICGICLLKSQVYSTPRSIALCPKCFLCDLKYLIAVVVVAAATVVDCPPQTPSSAPPIPQLPLPPPVNYMVTVVLVVAAAAVVDCPPPTNTAVCAPLPQSPLLPPVNYIVAVVVVAAATVVDCPRQTQPPVPQPPLPPLVNYMGKLVM